MWLNSAQPRRASRSKLLLASIKDGKPLPEKTFTDPELITAENFRYKRSYKAQSSCK